MKIEERSINELISPEYNPRQITDDELTKLKNSITTFGYVEPIIVNDVNNHILGGNQRYRAMKELGYKTVECNIVHLPDPNDEKALNLALNKISGDWDNEKLQDILKELELEQYDIELTGFTDIELKELEITSNESDEPDIPSNIDDFWENYAKFDKGTVYYEPSEELHEITELYKNPSTHLDELIDAVSNEEMKEMLRLRRDWFVEFDFKKLADYYANQATPEEQQAFEALGLVLLDLDQMLENNFTTLIKDYVTDIDLYRYGENYEK